MTSMGAQSLPLNQDKPISRYATACAAKLSKTRMRTFSENLDGNSKF